MGWLRIQKAITVPLVHTQRNQEAADIRLIKGYNKDYTLIVKGKGKPTEILLAIDLTLEESNTLMYELIHKLA